MAVDTVHPEYKLREPQWVRGHDVVGGTDPVKGKGTVYLPALGSTDTIQKQAKYEAYKARALFYGATSRTVQGLTGAIFRKDPKVEYPDSYKAHTEYFSSNGLSINGFAQEVIKEQLITSRLGILVDVAAGENVVDDRAYASLYTAENITNWATTRIGAIDVLTMVVLKEQYKKDDADLFEHESETQYRVLSLEKAENGDMIYVQNIWRKIDKQEKFFLVKDLQKIPTKSGKTLNEIPFFFVNDNNLTPRTSKPMLLDMVDVNLSHYVTSADLEHGAHFTALPTPWVAGFPADTVLEIGSGTAWVSSDVKANAGMLEYTGQGLGALEKRMEAKENMMAILGARMLEAQKVGVESEGAMKIRAAGEGGGLAVVSKTASEAMLKTLKLIASWSGITDAIIKTIEYELSTDFVQASMPPQELKELTLAWQSGAISQNTYLHNLQKGEMLPANTTVEDEIDRIDNENGGNNNDFGVGVTPVKRGYKINNNPVTGKPETIEET